MLINNILLKNTNNTMNLIYSHSDNKTFIRLLKQIYGSGSICLLEESIFAHRNINLIICNNRVDILDTCISLCHYFHSPLLIIDHKIKPSHLNPNQIYIPNITHRQIAIGNEIAQSWGYEIYDDILDLDITDSKNVDMWKKAIDDISMKPFKIQE
jgi:hypothetical protein